MSQLRRDLGLLDAVGIGFGAIIGAGIFVVTGVAAGMAGPAFLASLIIAGVAASANALSSAQLAASYPQSGGTYEYGYRLLSPLAGFLAGWMFLASKVAAAGTVAIGLAAYIDVLLPPLPLRAISVLAILTFTALHYFGVRRSSRVNLAIVAVSIATLLLFVLFGAPGIRLENFRPFAPFGWSQVLRASALLFFAYTGYARVATLGEEVRDPQTTIPRAVVITIVGAVLLYLAVAFVATGVAGTATLSATAAPLHAAAVRTHARWLPHVIAVGAITAMLGVMLSQVLGLSRMVFAMARRGDLPRGLATVDESSATPRRAVLLVGGAAAIVAGTGTLAGVAAASAFTILIYYGIANVCALRMARQQKLFADAVPWLGLVCCVLLALALPRTTIVTGSLVGGVGLLVRQAVRSMARSA